MVHGEARPQLYPVASERERSMASREIRDGTKERQHINLYKTSSSNGPWISIRTDGLANTLGF